MIFKGDFLIAEGTSCAAPVCLSSTLLSTLTILEDLTDCHTQVVAGIISLLNDFLISQDGSTLGFLNPLLYGELQYGLNDITYGLNPGCETGGFPAAVGWDPVRSTRLYIHFQFWLTLSSIGHRSRDPELSRTAENTYCYTSLPH